NRSISASRLPRQPYCRKPCQKSLSRAERGSKSSSSLTTRPITENRPAVAAGQGTNRRLSAIQSIFAGSKIPRRRQTRRSVVVRQSQGVTPSAEGLRFVILSPSAPLRVNSGRNPFVPSGQAPRRISRLEVQRDASLPGTLRVRHDSLNS